MSKKYSYRFCCSKETKEMIMKECRDLFLEENPDFIGMRITEDFILQRIAKYYLGRT